MKLFVDECCDAGLVDALRRDGHDVLYAVECAPGGLDEDVLSRGTQLHGCFVVLSSTRVRIRPLR